MAYDVKKVLNYGLNIVYGLTDSQISEIEQKVYKDYPEYRVEVSEIFKPVKLGPFKVKNKKNIAELILRYSKTPKADGRDFLNNYVFKRAKALECDHLMNRLPQSLSIGQKYRVSLITDEIDKKMKYLYKDFEEYNNTVNMQQYFNIFNWFNSDSVYDVYEYNVTWLTHVPEDELLAELKKVVYFMENIRLYTVENGDLVNKTILIEQLEAEERARESAQKDKEEQEKAKKAKIEKARTVRQQVQEKTKARQEEKADKPENIVLIEELIYECSVVPLAPHRLEGLMELLKEAGSAEHYAQFIEVIKMYLLTCQDIYGEPDVFYEDALEVCEKEMALLSSAEAKTLAKENEVASDRLKKAELEKMLDKMARRYLQKDDAESLFALMKAVANPDYYDIAIDIVNMYLSFHAGDSFFRQVKERCIKERDSLLAVLPQSAACRKVKRYFDDEDVSIIVLVAHDNYIMGCSYIGKIKAGDKFINSETGEIYKISGAIMINDKESPDDFVLSVDTGKINTFDCIFESASKVKLKSGDVLKRYIQPVDRQHKPAVAEENQKDTALTCNLKVINKKKLSDPRRRGGLSDAQILVHMLTEHYRYDIDVMEFQTKNGIKYNLLDGSAVIDFISASEDEVTLYVKGSQQAPAFECVLSLLSMHNYLDMNWYREEVQPRYNDIQVQYLYKADDVFVFKSINTYNSYEVYNNMISDDAKPLVENNSYRLLLVDEQPVGIRKDWLVN